ncbi:MAG: hypothetical protein IPK19_37265 [Chloroflexi bacterium]|nr:hypothetical protein [Chloroflexota bacterium]
MRRVNLSMLMLLCFTCAALFYLIAAQQSLSAVSAGEAVGDEQVVRIDANQSDTYFVTATLANSPTALPEGATETPLPMDAGDAGDDDDGVITFDEAATAEPRSTDAININATATATRTPTPINIGNFVWDDLDQDGRQDAGEPGLANVTVQLWNSAKSVLYDSDITNGSGFYTVVAPVPGNYRVRVVLPSINDQFSPKDLAGGDDTDDSDINPSGASIGFTDTISIASNVISISSIDGGIIKYRTPTPTRTPTPVNFGNFVWDDLDQDGRQDAGEPGLANVTVQLWNSAKSNLIDQDVTNSNGNYTLQSPGPGNYRVRVVLPLINDQFSPKDQAGGDDTDDSDINPTGTDLGFTDILVVASNVISINNIDAGIIKFRTPTPTRTPTPINIGNFVWDDLDGDGTQDGGEPGIAGVTVQLWNSTKTFMYDEAVTSATGIYTVVAPVPGSYRVRVIKPSSADDFSPKDANANNTLDSDVNPTGTDTGYTDIISIASNVISMTNVDIGIITADPVSIGNKIWEDLDDDGLQDAGEPGLAGRTVRLRYLLGGIIGTTIMTTTTDENGAYTVVAPEAGSYYVCLTTYTGEVISPMDQTDPVILFDDASDSDISPPGGSTSTGCTVIKEFVLGGLSNSWQDGGLITAHTSLIGNVVLEGHGAAPDQRWVVPVRVRIVPGGGGAALYDVYRTLDTTGTFLYAGATPDGLPPASYQFWVKHDHTLAALITAPTTPGNHIIDFGLLREGDANNDNVVSITDFSILASSFGASEGGATYDARADFDNNQTVNISDFSLLATNFGQAGEPMP